MDYKTWFSYEGEEEMNGALLLIPLLLIRYGIPTMVNGNRRSNISYFTPMIGIEKIMYTIYQIATLTFVILIFFQRIEYNMLGVVLFIFGIMLFGLSTYSFEKYSIDRVSVNGMYRFSRNPMYISYFIYFLACVLLTKSWTLFIVLIAFQISAHWIILSEERWCIEEFGSEYIEYMNRVRRYF